MNYKYYNNFLIFILDYLNIICRINKEERNFKIKAVLLLFTFMIINE